jgi:hypothetical protein
LAVSVAAAPDAGVAAPDGCSEPLPQAVTVIEVMTAQSVVSIREVMENDYTCTHAADADIECAIGAASWFNLA